ncbi:MAG: PLDc N-terminal domain-containing protein [Candidatus Sumerlaeia bacterium]|nr:PLDc N-terminal domain-containing protein [Candidatus Sumerlaeia bacterium]
MTQILTVIHLVMAIFAISDIMSSLRGIVPRVLWVICVVAVPILGSGFWFYVQYAAPAIRKRLQEQRREELRKRRRDGEIDP